jgi:hypothetical protein
MFNQCETIFSMNADGMKYWHKDSTDDSSNEVNPMWFRPPYSQAASVDIETTSYALLIYSRRKDLTGGVAIAKWIVAQRNANGGFSSTQVNLHFLNVQNYIRFYLMILQIRT